MGYAMAKYKQLNLIIALICAVMLMGCADAPRVGLSSIVWNEDSEISFIQADLREVFHTDYNTIITPVSLADEFESIHDLNMDQSYGYNFAGHYFAGDFNAEGWAGTGINTKLGGRVS